MERGEECVKVLKKIIRNEQGLSVIESVLITALIGAIIFALGPSLRQAFVGTPDNPGIGTTMVQHQTAGLNESSKNVKVLKGCQTIGSITADKCSSLENSK